VLERQFAREIAKRDSQGQPVPLSPESGVGIAVRIA
jgi:hypothetical protein